MKKIPLVPILFFTLFFYFFISEGLDDKKEYDKAQIVKAEILKYLHEVKPDELYKFSNIETLEEIELSEASKEQLVTSFQTLRGYGPGHPTNMDFFLLDFQHPDYKIELTKATISIKETVYINIIIEGKDSEDSSRFTFISDDLITWAQSIGLISIIDKN